MIPLKGPTYDGVCRSERVTLSCIVVTSNGRGGCRHKESNVPYPARSVSLPLYWSNWSFNEHRTSATLFECSDGTQLGFRVHRPNAACSHACCLLHDLGLRTAFGQFGAGWGARRGHGVAWRETTQEATQGQILSQSPTDATRFWWHLYGS